MTKHKGVDMTKRGVAWVGISTVVMFVVLTIVAMFAVPKAGGSAAWEQLDKELDTVHFDDTVHFVFDDEDMVTSVPTDPCACAAGIECEVTVNVADFFGKRKGNLAPNDTAKWEVGYHSKGGAWARLEFQKVPVGAHPQITRYLANVYSIYSMTRPTWGARGVALYAMHTKADFDDSRFNIRHCTDCLMWLQYPIGQGDTIQREDITHGLLTRDTLWLKLAVFNLPTMQHEVLSELTVSLNYCHDYGR